VKKVLKTTIAEPTDTKWQKN